MLEGACLVNVVPGSDGGRKGEDIKGSWLVFDEALYAR